jgi:hypothetical protein
MNRTLNYISFREWDSGIDSLGLPIEDRGKREAQNKLT